LLVDGVDVIDVFEVADGHVPSASIRIFRRMPRLHRRTHRSRLARLFAVVSWPQKGGELILLQAVNHHGLLMLMLILILHLHILVLLAIETAI